MRRMLLIVAMVLVLGLNVNASNIVGAWLVPARVTLYEDGQGQALPLRNIVGPEFLLAVPAPDGVGTSVQRSRKRRRHVRQRRVRVYRVRDEMNVTPSQNAPDAEPQPTGSGAAPDEAGAAPQPVMAAPPPAPSKAPGMDTPGKGATPNIGPRIKPPTVKIKPPTE